MEGGGRGWKGMGGEGGGVVEGDGGWKGVGGRRGWVGGRGKKEYQCGLMQENEDDISSICLECTLHTTPHYATPHTHTHTTHTHAVHT